MRVLIFNIFLSRSLSLTLARSHASTQTRRTLIRCDGYLFVTHFVPNLCVKSLYAFSYAVCFSLLFSIVFLVVLNAGKPTFSDKQNHTTDKPQPFCQTCRDDSRCSPEIFSTPRITQTTPPAALSYTYALAEGNKQQILRTKRNHAARFERKKI